MLRSLKWLIGVSLTTLVMASCVDVGSRPAPDAGTGEPDGAGTGDCTPRCIGNVPVICKEGVEVISQTCSDGFRCEDAQCFPISPPADATEDSDSGPDVVPMDVSGPDASPEDVSDPDAVQHDVPNVTDTDASAPDPTDTTPDTTPDPDTIPDPDTTPDPDTSPDTTPEPDATPSCDETSCDDADLPAEQPAPCYAMVCGQETGECEAQLQPDYCFIAGVGCVSDSDKDPQGCGVCDPAQANDDWSLMADGTTCDDGDACTTESICQQGICTLSVELNCDDDNVCTTDSCDSETGDCVHALTPSDASEDCDGVDNDCDGEVDEGWVDKCSIAGVGCFDVGEAHPDNACSVCEAGAWAAWTDAADGLVCDDGNSCTVNDGCNGAGACIGADKVCDDGIACTQDWCEPEVGCQSAEADGFCLYDKACDEDGLCTGVCVEAGAPEDDDPCLVCDPTQAINQPSPAPETDAPEICDGVDNDCDGEVDEAVLCDDAVDCTIDTCTGEAGCQYEPDPAQCTNYWPDVDEDGEGDEDGEAACLCDEPEGWVANDTDCDDAQGTISSIAPEVCDGFDNNCDGAIDEGHDDLCSIADVGCFDSGQLHPDNSCLSCTPDAPVDWTPAADGDVCDDGNSCSVGDTCSGGECVGDLTVNSEACSCCVSHDPMKPGCGDAEVEGVICPEDDYCCLVNWDDACAQKASEAGYCGPSECGDGLCNAEEAATAGLASQCEEPLDCGTSPGCIENSDCDDGNPCTVDVCSEIYSGGPSPVDAVCLHLDPPLVGATMDCDDGVDCTDDWCDLPGSTCVNEPNDATCDDADACTGAETCAAIGCVDGTPVDCDDGHDCTSDSCSAADGACASVLSAGCLIDDACVDEDAVSPQDDCLVCSPDLASDAWSSAIGQSCGAVYPFGGGVCGEAGCVSQCHAGRASCDGDGANGCEVALYEDPNNCGECGDVCPGALPWCVDGQCKGSCAASQVACGDLCVDTATNPEHCGFCDTDCLTSDPASIGVCDAAGCVQGACPEGLWNVDGLPGNGCEYICTATGEEACGGGDEDCDGTVDEGFDLNIDPLHCGSCGAACTHASVASWACVAATCYVDVCEPGLADLDGASDNGCEAEVAVAGELWVNAFNFLDPAPDGSQLSAFTSIQDALDAAEDGWTIHVLEGSYTGGLTSTVDGLTLNGAGSALVTVATGPGETGLLSTGSGITIRGMTFTGGQQGLYLVGAEEAPIESAVLKHVRVKDVVGSTPEHSYGIRVEYVTGLQLLDVGVHTMTAHKGLSDMVGFEGYHSYGIVVREATGVFMTDVWSENLLGGEGGPGGHLNHPGGPGGPAVGLRIEGSEDLTLAHVRAGAPGAGIIGGLGGLGFKWGDGKVGGLGAGLEVIDCSGVIIEGLEVSHLIGGRGGNTTADGQTGTGGKTVGLLIDGSSNVSVTGAQVHDLLGGHYKSADWSTFSYENVGGTSFGVWVRGGSSSVTLSGAVIRDLTGGRSSNYTEWWPPGDAIVTDNNTLVAAQGIVVEGSSGVVILAPMIHSFHNSAGTLINGAFRGVVVDTSEGTIVQNATVYGLIEMATPDVNHHSGVYVGANQVGVVTVLDSVLSVISGSCLNNASSNSGLLSALYTLMHACAYNGAAEPAPNATVSPTCIYDDPLFVDAAGGDLHLQVGSPAVDVGMPNAKVCSEPEPNGCGVNLGVYGGGPEAAVNASGVHCPCDDGVVCPEGWACSDGDPCTADACSGGACVGAAADLCE